MTYFGVLLRFILPPLVLLIVLVPLDLWRWLSGRANRPDLKPYAILLAHIAIALIYTTPWDNYLVATSVWWYDPNLVTGLKLGYVPVEEYTFFIVQTLLTGLWTIYLLRRTPARPVRANPDLRRRASLAIMLLWFLSLSLWLFAWQPGTYLNLILIWALLPVLLQAAFGADILLAHTRVLLPIIAVPTLYLWIVDGLAIASGTWTIDPSQTTGLKLGVLPIEEMLFFLMTNLIVGYGISLMLSTDSQQRARAWLQQRSGKRQAPAGDQHANF